MTNNYRKILIAQNCSLSFDSQVGLYLTEPVCQLVGELFLYKLKGKIFADKLENKSKEIRNSSFIDWTLAIKSIPSSYLIQLIKTLMDV